MGKHIRSHYLPKFYLARFADPALRKGKSQYVWVYEKGIGEPRKQNIEKVCVEYDLYALHEFDGAVDPESAEERLSRMESEAAKALRVFETATVLERKDCEWLAIFIATLIYRNPRFKRYIDTFVEERKRSTRASRVIMTMRFVLRRAICFLTRYSVHSVFRHQLFLR